MEAQDGSEGPPRTAEALHPEVGDPGPGGRDRRRAATPLEDGGRDPHVGTDRGAEGLERAGGYQALHPGAALPVQRRHEGAAAQDPGIPQVGLPPPAEGREARPAAQAAQDAAALELRPAPLGAPLSQEGAVRPARPGGRGAELGQDGGGVLPRARDGSEQGTVPVQGKRSRAGRLGTAWARRGFRWR